MRRTVALLLVLVMLCGVLALATCGCGGEQKSLTTEDVKKSREEIERAKKSRDTTAGMVGKYVSASNPADYIELRENNTFTWMRGGSETAGSYALEENDTRLVLSAGSFMEKMGVSGSTLTDSDGVKYDKQK